MNKATRGLKSLILIIEHWCLLKLNTHIYSVASYEDPNHIKHKRGTSIYLQFIYAQQLIILITTENSI
jgi:hypothetical protein